MGESSAQLTAGSTRLVWPSFAVFPRARPSQLEPPRHDDQREGSRPTNRGRELCQSHAQGNGTDFQAPGEAAQSHGAIPRGQESDLASLARNAPNADDRNWKGKVRRVRTLSDGV